MSLLNFLVVVSFLGWISVIIRESKLVEIAGQKHLIASSFWSTLFRSLSIWTKVKLASASVDSETKHIYDRERRLIQGIVFFLVVNFVWVGFAANYFFHFRNERTQDEVWLVTLSILCVTVSHIFASQLRRVIKEHSSTDFSAREAANSLSDTAGSLRAYKRGDTALTQHSDGKVVPDEALAAIQAALVSREASLDLLKQIGLIKENNEVDPYKSRRITKK